MDTGDLRYLYFGIPFEYHFMSEPERTQLIALAVGSNVLKPEWHSCAAHVGSNNADRMCSGAYARATAWIAVDRRLAQMIVEDIATYVRDTEGWHGLPASAGMLDFVIDRNKNGNWYVKPGWQQDPAALDYLQSKGYSPPATQPAGG
ncbi:MAG: hypothetical protein ABSH08_09310 [Tepidisphaeraceae bacterium]